MVRKESIKRKLIVLISLMAFHSYGSTDLKKETHNTLMSVNLNWVGLENEIEFTFIPCSEKEFVQLHLYNVVSYLEAQPVIKLNEQQKQNRELNIAILRKYSRNGEFPINNTTPYRVPIFIDYSNVHCAVGFLLKENGLGDVAQEIAQTQLLSYLANIEHSKFGAWQKNSGLSLFELALIQPTYGPAIPVCATPSPIQWNSLKEKDSRITQLINGPNDDYIYSVLHTDALGMKQEIKRFSSSTKLWTSVGEQITGQILDLVFCQNALFISVLLPNEKYPHQVLKLNGDEWEKVAHFNGSIQSIQAFQKKLYVLGYFKKVNNSIASNFVVIDGKSIKPFHPIGFKNVQFDHMKSSKTALFLTSNGGIHKFKNDTITYLTSIQYYQYITNIELDAIQDSVYVTSFNIPGYHKYFKNNSQQTGDIGCMLYGQDYPYSTIQFTKSKMVNGKMMIAGDFKSSTLIPQINDERYLTRCADSLSGHWFGEGLIYQHGRMYYPILNEGIVLDFVQMKDQIYVLKKDGSISYASLDLIEEKIIKVKKGPANTIQD